MRCSWRRDCAVCSSIRRWPLCWNCLDPRLVVSVVGYVKGCDVLDGVCRVSLVVGGSSVGGVIALVVKCGLTCLRRELLDKLVLPGC